MSHLRSPKLEHHLLQAADILRGEDSRWEGFEDHLFALLLFKRLCDLWEEEAQRQAQDGESPSEEPKPFRPELPPEHHWSRIREQRIPVGPALDQAFRALQTSHPILAPSLNRVDFTNSTRLPETRLHELLAHFDTFSLRNRDISPTVLATSAEAAFAQLQDLHGTSTEPPLSLQSLHDLGLPAPTQPTGMVEFLQELGYVNTGEHGDD